MIEIDFQLFRRVGVAISKVQVDDGIRLPVVVHLVDGQSLEQLSPTLKYGFQRRDQQRLPETSRTRQEILPERRLHELVDVVGLIDIQETVRDYIVEIKCAGADRFHASPYQEVVNGNLVSFLI